MIAFFAFVVGTCLGIAIGTALVRPYLDSPPKQRKPKEPSLVHNLHAVTWQRIEIPTVQRRQ